MSIAIDVLCNKDLFLHIESFVHGYERVLIDFSHKFRPKLSWWRLLEETLADKNFKVANKINKLQVVKSNVGDLSLWEIKPLGIKYPHRAYSLMSTCEWLNSRMGDKFLSWRNYMDTAASMGDLNLVMFMHSHRPEGCKTYAMDWAARNGNLKVLQFLHENRTEGCTTVAMDTAALNGHLNIVKFLHKYRKEGCTTNAVDWAAEYGHLDIVKFLCTYRTEGWTWRALDFTRNKEIIKFLQEAKTSKLSKFAEYC